MKPEPKRIPGPSPWQPPFLGDNRGLGPTAKLGGHGEKEGKKKRRELKKKNREVVRLASLWSLCAKVSIHHTMDITKSAQLITEDSYESIFECHFCQQWTLLWTAFGDFPPPPESKSRSETAVFRTTVVCLWYVVLGKMVCFSENILKNTNWSRQPSSWRLHLKRKK